MGDAKTPALKATGSALRNAVDQSREIAVEPSGNTSTGVKAGNVAAAVKTAGAQRGDAASCKQVIWFSFFFDGTGNNRDADLELLKHSNIARLYRAHKETNIDEGISSVYIPGVGTYFREIGDDGGSTSGNAFGAMGEARLEFAAREFEGFLRRPLALAKAPGNAIKEINIAVFGFSRGAALARAFLNLLMKRYCRLESEKWRLRQGNWPVRFRFAGLFDTVASVGLPMSTNNTGIYDSVRSDVPGMIAERLDDYENTRPETLAFSRAGEAGADPAPGKYAGHTEWGARLHIHETVEEVRHLVAAHEYRNSFPLDSIRFSSSTGIPEVAHFHEIIYPGVHSDVGGGYTPGEGARASRPSQNLCLIALQHMYNFALKSGVPMSLEKSERTRSDFNLDAKVGDAYNHYVKAIGSFSTLGEGINRHMAMYYAWRFYAIRKRLEGDVGMMSRIRSADEKFQNIKEVKSKEVNILSKKSTDAQIALSNLMELREIQASISRGGDEGDSAQNRTDLQLQNARQEYNFKRDQYLRSKARLDALPNMERSNELMAFYDQQLLIDVRRIRDKLSGKKTSEKPRNRDALRPHYKFLLDAFENEFDKGRGLRDEKILWLFDNCIHDSLSGFGKDATLPSDPRVVYIGGDVKLKYARLDTNKSSEQSNADWSEALA
ncbi:DUF2235 domain-containing protein [Massilia sp. Se16.2.3]|uniref:T6SS phospholipase effector Tle1-like catalytic domain-containing protein n=1 Tax=Massilia sp. Se16.2.3 TaxID=2709303 RepID=UPI001AEEE11B|nr:DUF2235 domain-containing protein [Massilia sp. Se16.2.3]